MEYYWVIWSSLSIGPIYAILRDVLSRQTDTLTVACARVRRSAPHRQTNRETRDPQAGAVTAPEPAGDKGGEIFRMHRMGFEPSLRREDVLRQDARLALASVAGEHGFHQMI